MPTVCQHGLSSLAIFFFFFCFLSFVMFYDNYFDPGISESCLNVNTGSSQLLKTHECVFLYSANFYRAPIMS